MESGKRKTDNAEGYQRYPYDQHCSGFVGEKLAPPETYVKMTLIRGANACFRREDQRSSENDGRFIDRKRRIGYKRSCHAVRRQAPYPTKRTFPLQLLYCDRRPAAGAASRSPTISLQRLL